MAKEKPPLRIQSSGGPREIAPVPKPGDEGIFKPPGTDLQTAFNWLSSLSAQETPKFGVPGLFQDRYRREANQVLGAADRFERGESPWQESLRLWTGQAPPTPPSNTNWWQAPTPGTPATGQPVVEEPPATDYLAQAIAMLGGGPDYGAYRAALTDQTAELNARIQAMYNQLAEQAGANQERIAGVYDTAQSGVGNVYDSATQNVANAYSSSQQQAADQLARLGIEAAAPAVINPAALSQAQAVSGLEQGRAGGLSALNRYGSTAQGFASQMGQVAQQQGTEFNSALLNSLQRQLADSLGMEAQGAYNARLQAPGLARDLYEASQIGQPQSLSIEDQLAMQEAASRQAEAAVEQYNQTNRIRNDYLELLLGAGYDYEEALAEVDLQYPRTVM